MFEQYSLWAGIAIAAYALVKTIMDKSFAFILFIAAIGMIIYHFSAKAKIQKVIQRTIEVYSQKLESGKQIIRAMMAEVVDFREEFAERDAESKDVLDFLEQIKPEEYIRKIGNNERKII